MDTHVNIMGRTERETLHRLVKDAGSMLKSDTGHGLKDDYVPPPNLNHDGPDLSYTCLENGTTLKPHDPNQSR